MPAFSFQGDDIIFTPEEFNFFWENEFVLSVEIRILEDKEIIVVIDVYLRTLVYRPTVLNVKGVKMKLLLQFNEILFRRVSNMMPFQFIYC